VTPQVGLAVDDIQVAAVLKRLDIRSIEPPTHKMIMKVHMNY